MNQTSKLGELGRMAPAKLRRIILGMRYEPRFGLMDNIGTVIDVVLRAKGTPFGPETFPLQQSNQAQQALTNLETGASLRFTTRDTVLQMPCDTSNLDRIGDLARQFQDFVLTPLREVPQIESIARYGVVAQLEGPSTALEHPPIARYLSTDFTNVQYLSMRFARRIPYIEAIVKKRVDDFRNLIYMVEQSEGGNVSVSLDHQLYFRPLLNGAEWNGHPFSDFADLSIGLFEQEFGPWFKKASGASEVA